MAQWSFPVPTVNNESPLPVAIPEAWQKANEALQAVQQPKSGKTEAAKQTQQESTSDFSNAYGWANPNMYTAYPGYAGFPANYGLYNYNFNYYMNNSHLYMNAMPSSQQTPVSIQTILSPTVSSSDSKLEDSHSEDRPVLISAPQPPPPSPPSSPPSDTVYFTNIVSKQAPGVGSIKFSLPKKKNQNKMLQSPQESFQANSMTQRENSTNGQMQQNILQQKSVSSMPKEEWPPSLRNYVNECFRKCKSDIDKDQVEIILKGKLGRAFNDGSIYTKDWDSEPLPSIHSERLEQEEKISAIKNQSSRTNSPKNHFPHRNRNYMYMSRSRSRSYSRSRSRSRTPPRRVIKKRRHSGSSDSSNDSRGSKKTLSSSIIGPSEFRSVKSSSKNKKRKKKGNKLNFSVDPEYSSNERLQKRAARFGVKEEKNRGVNLVFTIANPFVIDDTGADIEWQSDAITGTCQDLVKPFLRLTGAVDPSTVRPEEVLIKSLTMVKDHWIQNRDYHFACEQLKSVRQDLVVQCIRNEFTVEVYETHARIALENGDHKEFNQCQSQLKVLYQEIEGSNRLEFTGYHILYTLYTENTLEIKNILAKLTPEDKKDEVVAHALKLVKAWSSNNYHRFFKVYLSAPKMSSFIIDWFIERIRKSALKAIIKSFRQFLPVSYIESALAFPCEEECMAFLAKANLVFTDTGVINCKESMASVANF